MKPTVLLKSAILKFAQAAPQDGIVPAPVTAAAPEAPGLVDRLSAGAKDIGGKISAGAGKAGTWIKENPGTAAGIAGGVGAAALLAAALSRDPAKKRRRLAAV